MRHWRQIRDRLMIGDFWNAVRGPVRIILKAGESPRDPMMLAAMGLAMIGLVSLVWPDSEPLDELPDTIDAATAQHDMNAADNPDRAPAAGSADTAAASTDITDSRSDLIDPAVETLRLKSGETLLGLLKRAGIESRSAHAAVSELKKVSNLRQIKAGQQLSLMREAGDAGMLAELSLRDSFDATATVRNSVDGYKADRTTIPTIALTRLVEGEITDSLYMSGKRAGLPDKILVELIRLLSFDVDFERDIRMGDKFQVYFERTYAPGMDEMQDGRLLQAHLSLKAGDLEANYYEDTTGRGDYYDAKGKSTRKALMKTPLDVAVMTSRFGSRKHPVLGYTRMHKGVDFRASTGTPVMAAGDGVVERASRYGSYGNYIRIRHNGTYSTAYAHLSRYGKGVKAGAMVRQGQVIGYAGATGRVSGAHLHYEVLVNGAQANPMNLKLPTGHALKGTELAAYTTRRGQILADIGKIQLTQQVLLAQAPESRAVNTQALDENDARDRVALTP